MKRFRQLFCLALALGLLTGQPFLGLAGEHGGKEHAGEEHGGAEEAKEHAGEEGVDEDMATLLEAATALEATHPELAAKLRAMAGEEVAA